ncbi:hypothetical protein BDQ17DRAFT_1408842 [Cyathus striatus]|nr:hypothetical protein BDQ17DRAFT_1408842 [Cyathus striatus]
MLARNPPIGAGPWILVLIGMMGICQLASYQALHSKLNGILKRNMVEGLILRPRSKVVMVVDMVEETVWWWWWWWERPGKRKKMGEYVSRYINSKGNMGWMDLDQSWMEVHNTGWCINEK